MQLVVLSSLPGGQNEVLQKAKKNVTLQSIFVNDMSFNQDNEGQHIVQMSRLDINEKDFNKEFDVNDLPILATRNLVLFPDVNIPISITRDTTLALANVASERHIPVGIVCQTNPEEEHPTVKGLYTYGVIADVLKVIELPDGSRTALIHGRNRFKVLGRGEGVAVPGALSAKIKVMQERKPSEKSEFVPLMKVLTETAVEILAKSHNGDQSFAHSICDMPDMVERLNSIATNIPGDTEEKMEALSRPTIFSRAEATLSMALATKEKMSLYEDILKRAQVKMNETQRNAFLQMQLDTIKEELDGDFGVDSDVENLIKKADDGGMPEYARNVFDKEIGKLRRLNVNSPDYSVQYSYLETLADMPWKTDDTATDIQAASDVLESNHYGLEKVNQRILEQIAVLLSSRQKIKAPILCLVGPPGVGKTSLGKAVAKAMGRKYRRVALGGVHDESEIRGHRRTYIGAMPGRIIKAIREAGATNPVLMLDEVDKLGHDHRGDPASALLEVLDPEQNSTFHDNYLDIDYDLSDVLFIATANDISKVDGPLRDRMEVIELSGYLPEEKVEIAKRHLIPKVLDENGVKDEPRFEITDEALLAIIEDYTAESGVRTLEKHIATLVRKMILSHLAAKSFPVPIAPGDLKDLLGNPKFNKDKYESNNIPGVVTGLAWTAAGGEILLAEASLSPGKGDRISITGNLGDVMKESATIALQWVKAHHGQLGIPEDKFDKYNLHIHFPEGAIPKDGPSAGITIATAIASAFTGRLVAERIAMTGELTLRGKVLPVGGIREKMLAARRAGIDTVVLSRKNERDVEEIPAAYREGMTFKYVDTMDEVLDAALI